MGVLPGLWEMHAHFAQVEWGEAYLAAGVTSARDCGGEFEVITAERDAIERGSARPGAAGARTRAGARYKASGFVQMKIYQRMKRSPAMRH